MRQDGAVAVREGWQRVLRTYKRFTVPAEDGLPHARVLLAFPLALLILGAALVGLGLNGSSSGAFYPEISTGVDPALIAGEPELTRSDEWNVGTVWTIAQVEQGLTRSTMRIASHGDRATFDLVSTPTEIQRLAFELIGRSIPTTLK